MKNTERKPRRPFKAPPRFMRYGEGRLNGGYRMGGFRSFSTLRAAMRGIRLDVAELVADGVKLPADICLRYEKSNRKGEYDWSEVVAIWKRGRFVWVDPLFKSTERGARQ